MWVRCMSMEGIVPDELEPMHNSVLVVRNTAGGSWTVEDIR